jgi:hypothetical protein
VPAKIDLPSPAAQTECWALDERGERRERVPVAAAPGGHSCVNVGPEWRTLWYEILVSKTTKGSEK